jgi:N-acetylglucosaminyldiphosphoundecaprenol N-acetyl-beta-D-mannosaminyltransferase
MTIPRASILGVGVSAITMEMALRTIEAWISRREHHYVCVTGVHGVMESWRDEDLRRIHNAAGLVTADGMPLVWLSHLMGFRPVERVYGPDLMLAVCECSAEHCYRHFFYGGALGAAEKLASRLQSRFPGLQVVGIYSPPFRALSPEEDTAVVDRINEANPDIVWVGMSTPKQERWMSAHRGQLTAPVLIGVGAAFDFHAGLKRQAPHWMQRSGLEWLFRLVLEPRRLWRRYLINNPWFLWLVLFQALSKGPRRPESQVGLDEGSLPLKERVQVRESRTRWQF